MEEIAEIIYLALSDFEKNQEECAKRVKTLLDKYPLY